jgi:hypothetical protein
VSLDLSLVFRQSRSVPAPSYGKFPDRLTKAGDLFIRGLPYLPPPGVGGVEGEFVLTVSGITYGGKIDYRGPLPASAMFLGRHEDIACVTLDHKTSSNPAQYGMHPVGPKDWYRDAQAIIYATRHMIETKGDVAPMRWLYYRTKKVPEVKPADTIMERARVQDVFGEWIHPLASELTGLLETRPDPNELRCNTEACNDFNKPCFYANVCKRTLAEQVRGALVSVDNLKRKKEKKQDMDLFANLKALVPQQPGQATPSAAPVAQATTPGFQLPQAFAQPQPQAQVSAPVAQTATGFALPAAFAGVNAPESKGLVAIESAPPAVNPLAAALSAPAPVSPNAYKVICEELAQAFARAASRL